MTGLNRPKQGLSGTSVDVSLATSLSVDGVSVSATKPSGEGVGMTAYDAIVIGAGQAGPGVAAALAEQGKQVALIEMDRAGGTCLNHGCKPTKTLRATASVAHQARRAAEYGVHVGPVSVDFGVAITRVRRIIGAMQESIDGWLDGLDGVDYIHGRATLRSDPGGQRHVVRVERDGADRSAGLPERRGPGLAPAHPRTGRRRVDDRGRTARARRTARAPHRGRGRLHRMRVRPDVRPIRFAGHDGRRRQAGRPRGPGHLRTGGHDADRGRRADPRRTTLAGPASRRR